MCCCTAVASSRREPCLCLVIPPKNGLICDHVSFAGYWSTQLHKCHVSVSWNREKRKENLWKKWQEEARKEAMASKVGPLLPLTYIHLPIYTHIHRLQQCLSFSIVLVALGFVGEGNMGRKAALFLALVCFFSGATRRVDSARVFTIINQCKTDIWPAVTPGESFVGGGLSLHPGQSVVFTAPVGWSGRVWGRTGCSFDSAGNGTCETGGCGTSLQCASSSGATPASLVEFTLASVDYYDVSLVDGFNLPIVVTPAASANGSSCAVAGCDGDLRQDCPSELAVKDAGGKTVVACRSACDVFGTDQYCCRGQYANPVTCQPTFYSKKFKAACPGAYSYAYDDPSSIFTCTQSPDYTIIFCSNRKQSVCSYHNERLVCSGSSRSWPSSTALALVLLTSFMALLSNSQCGLN